MAFKKVWAWATSHSSFVGRWLSSERTFYVILGLLAFQAIWLALSAQYPMAFDENFHFGLIQLHASQWQPYFTHQPAHADQFGAIVRDPSYLYHFLLSLPYHFIALITANQLVQIVLLRILNVGLALWGFVLARRLMRKVGSSTALVNACLLLVCLVPIVPFLAAQINYDNLFIPLVMWSLLSTCRIIDDLAEKTISPTRLLGLLTLLFITSLVKYAFLPIAFAIGAFLLWKAVAQRSSSDILWQNFKTNVKRASLWRLVLLTVALVAASILFTERYVGNIVHYHALNPDCSQVLTVQQCHNYGPWERDFNYAQQSPRPNPSKLAYLWHWPFGLWFRSFFAISHTYDTQLPLPLPSVATITLALLGLILFGRYAKRLLIHNAYRQVVLFTIISYVGALFYQTFEDYLRTGEPVAINGRYLLPFLPVIFIYIGLAYRELWQSENQIKNIVMLCSIVFFLQGGGMLAFIIRSQDSWYLPNPIVVNANHTVREVLKKIVVGSTY